MAKKATLLCVEMGAHAVHNKGKVRWGWFEQVRVSCGAWLCVVIEAFWAVWRRQLSLCGASPPPQGVMCKAPLSYEGWCEGNETLGGLQIMGCKLACLRWRCHWRQRKSCILLWDNIPYCFIGGIVEEVKGLCGGRGVWMTTNKDKNNNTHY
jgi:hypothetical protein